MIADRCTRDLKCSTYRAIHLQGCLQAVLAAKLDKGTFDIPCIFMFQDMCIPYLHNVELLVSRTLSNILERADRLACLKTLEQA